MIHVAGLSKSFYGQTVLDGIDLDVAAGEIVAVLGESGTGKSVLLKHLIGLLRPDTGVVEVCGEDVTRMRERDLLRLRTQIGYLFQDGALFDFMTVFENVAFPLLEHTELKKAKITAKVMAMLEQIGLKEAAPKYPSELSGGMRKRAALARSVILDSKILLCDEPTSGLDPIRSRQISDLIKDCARKIRCTTVITSHDMANAFRVADRVIFMERGKIAAAGTPEELKNSSAAIVRAFLE